MDVDTARKSALEFIKGHHAGVIATAGHDNQPHASAVYYVADEHFNVYFLTKVNSRKYNAIQAHPQVAFTIGRLDVPQTLQIEGVASELRSDEAKQAHIPDLMDMLEKTNPYYVPIAKMDSEVVLIWIQPKWIRWGDFAVEGIGDDQLFTEIPVQSE
jgi:nitroimidazol reductase NimA-like FMN-containing flavoprotein (pyridoxamine 5'-phosphate oxidase superfamily)